MVKPRKLGHISHMSYAITRIINVPFAEAEARVREELHECYPQFVVRM